MVIVRPSILAASDSEPMPGWTDTQGLLGGMTLAVGLGVMRDTLGNPESFLDVIPVDYVARQLLVAIAYGRYRALQTQGREDLLVVQSTTSASNPVSAGKFFSEIIKYQNNFPYEKRAGAPSLT